MKVSEAEKLICPFMSNVVATANHAGQYDVLCQADKCMAWEIIKTDFTREEHGETQPFEREQCEGYCRRIGK